MTNHDQDLERLVDDYGKEEFISGYDAINTGDTLIDISPAADVAKQSLLNFIRDNYRKVER